MRHGEVPKIAEKGLFVWPIPSMLPSPVLNHDKDDENGRWVFLLGHLWECAEILIHRYCRFSRAQHTMLPWSSNAPHTLHRLRSADIRAHACVSFTPRHAHRASVWKSMTVCTTYVQIRNLDANYLHYNVFSYPALAQFSWGIISLQLWHQYRIFFFFFFFFFLWLLGTLCAWGYSLCLWKAKIFCVLGTDCSLPSLGAYEVKWLSIKTRDKILLS